MSKASNKDLKVEEARAAAAKRSTKKKGGGWMGYYIACGFVVVATILGVILAAGGDSKPSKKGASGASSLDKLVNDKGVISDANRGPNFTAAASPFFDKWTLADVKWGFDGAVLSNMVGMAGAVQRCEKDDSNSEGGVIPRNFDARTHWPECSWEIYDSGNCTSSYAIAAASSLSARFCVSDQELYKKTRLSPQQVLSCDKKNQKCAGGGIDSVWAYIQRRGLYPEECLPYAGKKGAECKTTCEEKRKLKPISHCVMSGIKDIKRDILEFGPVVAPLMLSHDFMVYSGGVFTAMDNSNRLFGSTGKAINQAVTIIGWGVDEGTPYWLIENSWGTSWGIDGYARVAIGNGPVLEHYIVAGYPETAEALEQAAKKKAEEDVKREQRKKDRAERDARIAEREKVRADAEAAQRENDDFDDIDDDVDLDFDDGADAAKSGDADDEDL